MPAVNMIIENATLLNTAGKYCDKDIVVVPVVQPDNVRVTLEITLKAAEWVDNKQIVESATITEDSTLVVSHTMADVQAYLDSGIMLASAEVGKMEFTCVVVPTEDIKVLVHIVDPLITAGGALPEITAEDDGKFLRAVGGAYRLVALTDVSVEGL